ncbi:MAG: hypothetical protein PHZ26_02700 [Candidatus Gracilibacteria bacterium]|nr:hypothetical protein [Candidatus Gracilibacteria bacterium]MDD2908642.1 hypothetical protein [Candidatus Gracilibacteria bacterium]
MTDDCNSSQIYEYKFILGEISYTVKDSNELGLIFEMLAGDKEISPILHWNIIMELDENLINIIKSYKGLINCLKYLNEKNSFLLLVKISDELPNIVQDARELGEILARIYEENNKLRLIRQMRNKGLTRLITSSQDLLNIMEWVYDCAEKETLEILGPETIRGLFIYPQDIYNVLHYLNKENKDYLIELIGLNEISKKIKSWQDFLLLLKGMSYIKVKQFLSLYSRHQIKDFFKNDREFKYFLMKLSDKKEELFLEYLGINKK